MGQIYCYRLGTYELLIQNWMHFNIPENNEKPDIIYVNSWGTQVDRSKDSVG